jgi:hypothetical protein
MRIYNTDDEDVNSEEGRKGEKNVLHRYTYFLLLLAVIVISFPFLALQ